MPDGRCTRTQCPEILREVDGSRAVAALEAVRTAIIEYIPQNSTNLWLCLDNISVVEEINTKADRIGTSQLTIDKTRGEAGGSRETDEQGDPGTQ